MTSTFQGNTLVLGSNKSVSRGTISQYAAHKYKHIETTSNIGGTILTQNLKVQNVASRNFL